MMRKTETHTSSVVDDTDSFVGIVTRRDIMRYYYKKIKMLEKE